MAETDSGASMKYKPKVGDQVELASPATWLGHGCDVDAVYTVTGVKVGDFGSGIGAQVVPAIQLHHRDGDQVWYDAAHFKPHDRGFVAGSVEPTVRLPAEYERLLDECCKVAGRVDWFWNERFVSALQRRGLTLATARHPHDRDDWYPSGYPMQSPHPYPQGPDAWPIGALVVWKPSRSGTAKDPLS